MEHKWNLEAVFPENTQWETEYAEVAPLIDELKGYRGKLGESAKTLLASFELRDNINQRLERLYAYARMRRDEDNTNPQYQALEDRARALWACVEEASAFFNPELLEVGREKINEFIASSEGLKLYEHMLDDLFREQEHLLSAQEEALLAAVSEVAAGPSQIYDMLTDADMKFGTIKNEDGEEVELSQGRYLRYILSPDRDVRASAFRRFHEF